MSSARTSWPLDPTALRELRIQWPTEYGWHPSRWVEPILHGMRSHGVRVERRAIPQPFAGAVSFEAWFGRQRLPVIVDYNDLPGLVEGGPAQAAVYFKLQYDENDYPHRKVIPGGYVTASQSAYRYLWFLRQVRRRRPARYDVYGRFGLRQGAELRRHAVELLSDRSDLSFAGGLTRYDDGPSSVSYRTYLLELARARVCLDLPGKGDLCFRLVECLALGACVVGPPPRVRLHVPLVDGEHVVHCAADLSDLPDVCVRLVRDSDTRERIARSGRDFFDRYLHRRQLGAYYLHEIMRVADVAER